MSDRARSIAPGTGLSSRAEGQPRLDLHNANVEQAAAERGQCGTIDLRHGRTCRQPALHTAGCEFAFAGEGLGTGSGTRPGAAVTVLDRVASVAGLLYTVQMSLDSLVLDEDPTAHDHERAHHAKDTLEVALVQMRALGVALVS